jgi:nitrate/nitrite transport system substrate-binding protein
VKPAATARPAKDEGVWRISFELRGRLFTFQERVMHGKRREFLRQAGAAGLMSLVPETVRVGAWAAGSDAPEKKEVRIGFIPLTDCASVVIASVMKFDEKHGVKITPSKEASWAAVRD